MEMKSESPEGSPQTASWCEAECDVESSPPYYLQQSKHDKVWEDRLWGMMEASKKAAEALQLDDPSSDSEDYIDDRWRDWMEQKCNEQQEM